MPINLPLTPDQVDEASKRVKARGTMIEGLRRRWDVGPSNIGRLEGGIEAIGRKVGDSFVKTPHVGSSPKVKGLLKGDFVERLINEEFLADRFGEDIVPGNRYNFQTDKGIVSVSDYIEDSTPVDKKVTKKLLKDKIQKEYIRGSVDINAPDLHEDNIRRGKVIDTGHIEINPMDKQSGEGLRKAAKTVGSKNINSPASRKLTMKYAKELGKRLPMVSGLVALADYLSGNKDALADAVMPFSPSVVGEGSDTPPFGGGRSPDSQPLSKKEQAVSLIASLLEDQEEQELIQGHIRKTGVAPTKDPNAMQYRRVQQLESNRLQMRALMNETGMSADDLLNLVEKKAGARSLKLIDMFESGDLEGLQKEEQRTRKPKTDEFDEDLRRPSLIQQVRA
jgi:hypothetical protein